MFSFTFKKPRNFLFFLFLTALCLLPSWCVSHVLYKKYYVWKINQTCVHPFRCLLWQCFLSVTFKCLRKKGQITKEEYFILSTLWTTFVQLQITAPQFAHDKETNVLNMIFQTFRLFSSNFSTFFHQIFQHTKLCVFSQNDSIDQTVPFFLTLVIFFDKH